MGLARDLRVPLDMVRYNAAAQALADAGGYDIVHVQEPYLAGPVRHEGKVTTIHDTSYGEVRAILKGGLDQYALRKTVFYLTLGYAMEYASLATSRAVIAPSPQVRDELVYAYRWRRTPVYVVPNGVDPPRGEPPREEARRRLGLGGELIVFTTAQHIPRKRLDLLVRAAALLAPRWRGRARVVIGGDGPQTPMLRRLARDLGVDDFVFFTGWLGEEELVLYYNACDVFVLTSEYEAGPQTLLEAAVRGCPIVSSRIPLYPALMRNGVEAILYPPGDYEALAEALDRVLSDPGLRESLSRGARSFASRFTWDRIAALTEAVYRRVRR